VGFLSFEEIISKVFCTLSAYHHGPSHVCFYWLLWTILRRHSFYFVCCASIFTLSSTGFYVNLPSDQVIYNIVSVPELQSHAVHDPN
jgi:hypothetical protein